MDYVKRVNCAIDHIVSNLALPLSLEEVSEVAGFSRFHFHRVFKALVGEALNQFVKRQRLERALYLMSHAPKRSLTEVALDCGFSSSSDFSRSFKQRYGASPRVFNLDAYRNSRREEFERVLSNQNGFPRFATLPEGQNPDGFEVTLRDLPARTVAYIRVLDPYRDRVTQAACERLLSADSQVASGSGTCGRNRRSSPSRIVGTTLRSWWTTSSRRVRSDASSSHRCAWLR